MDQFFTSLTLTVLAIHLLAVMSPGPDYIMLVRNALSYSRKTGVYTAIGLGLGIGVHSLYSILGLSLIISKSPIIYDLIKYTGAAYLAYIGIMSLKSKQKNTAFNTPTHKTDISILKAIRTGFLTNVLNPKATLFFLSLFTVVVGPNAKTSLLVSLGAMMMINTALWFSILAYLVTHSKILPTFQKNESVLNKIFGILLIGIAIKVAFF